MPPPTPAQEKVLALLRAHPQQSATELGVRRSLLNRMVRRRLITRLDNGTYQLYDKPMKMSEAARMARDYGKRMNVDVSEALVQLVEETQRDLPGATLMITSYPRLGFLLRWDNATLQLYDNGHAALLSGARVFQGPAYDMIEYAAQALLQQK